MGMSSDKLTIGLLSDFNIQNLAVLLQKHSGPLSLNCKQAPYGHTTSVLLNGQDDFWSAPYDALIIWTLPDRVIPSFNRVASFEEYSIDALLTEVDSFAAQIREIPG